MTKTIDFNDLSRGTIVDNEYTAQGVTITSWTPEGDNRAMIFDSSNPTGGDHDLATNNLGKVLILSEDRDSHDPDDEAHGGKFTFTFDEETDVKSLTFLDIEEGATIKFYNEHGQLIAKHTAHTADNGQVVKHFNVDGVARMDVILHGSGAIDNLVYDNGPDLDGLVEGTNGNDVIDAGYTGDPDGDRIDNNDAILGDDAPNDDRVYAFGGDDIIKSGAGDDLVFAGTGNDMIFSGNGDDVIYGEEGNDKVEASWGDDLIFGGAGNDDLWASGDNDVVFGGEGADSIDGGHGNDTLSGDEGNDEVSGGSGDDKIFGGAGDDKLFGDRIRADKDDNGVAGDDHIEGGSGNDKIEGGDGNDTLIGDGGEEDLKFVVDWDVLGSDGHKTFTEEGESVGININTPQNAQGKQWFVENGMLKNWDVTSPSTADLHFDREVENVKFTLLDVDALDKITIMAKNDAGQLQEVTFQDTGVHAVNGNMVVGTQTTNDGPAANNNQQDIEVTIDGPISHLWIILDDGPERDYSGTVAVTDIHFTIPVDGEDGDDMIDGGAGDDIIEGNGGDDMLTGGEGADDIFGGDDADIIFGGAGDNVDGGAGGDDCDTLDLTGQGSFLVTGPDGTGEPVVDSNGNGLDGRIVFVDDNGDPTGETLDFVEIEKIVGDQVEPNEAPTAGDDGFDADEDNTTDLGNVLGNDNDPDGDALEVFKVAGDEANLGQPVAGSNGGLITINADGSASFDPNGEFEELAVGETAETSVTYMISDGNGGMDTATVIVTVDGQNDAPDAVDDTSMTDEDTSVVVDLLANDTDLDGDTLMVTFVSVPAEQGTVVDNGDGTATFTPADGFNGTAMISYDIKDGNGGRDWAKHFVEVKPVNDGPVATDDTGETDQDTATDLDNVLGNDSDEDGDDLEVFKVGGDEANLGQPVAGDNGGLITINADGSASFDPNGEFDGLAEGETAETSVTYMITDGNGGMDTATVTVTVTGTNEGPVATNDEDATDQDTAIDLDNVLGNDSDPDGDDLEVFKVGGDEANLGQPVAGDNGGLITINADGSASFDPNGEFDGLAEGETAETSVTYMITDGNGGMDTATVTVTVTGTNEGPVATNDEDATDQDTAIDLDNVLGNDSDPDGDDLEVFKVGGDEANLGQPVAGDNGGLITINADGSASFDPNGEFDGLAEGETAETSVTYMITDGNGGMDTATVTVTVTGTNEGPVATNDEDATDQDTAIDLDNVLGNDSDPDGDDLEVFKVGGDEANLGQPVAGDNGGLITINADGSASFDPNGEFDGLAEGETAETSVTYMITDGNGGMDTATVTVTVTGTNEAPTAENSSYVVDASEGAGDVDGNAITDDTGEGADSDPDGDPLTVVKVAGDAANVGNAVAGDNGGLFTINADGTVDFDANGEFDDLGLGETATTTVTYMIADPDGQTDTATVTFEVKGINDGTVQGTDGNDVINPDIPYVDEDGDIVDAGDGILPGDEGTDNDVIDAMGGDDQIDAGEGDDVVFGGTGSDHIEGGNGDDELNGEEGNDGIRGDAGDDKLFGGAGEDVIFGGADDDMIFGGADDDGLVGDDGNDMVDGGDGDDRIFGNAGDDELFGGDGNDTIEGGTGDDNIEGGEGDDDLWSGAGNDTVDGGAGNDTLNGAAGNDKLIGGEGDDILEGVGGNDMLEGGDGNDILDGGNADDMLEGGAGNDTLIGGTGEDMSFGGTGDDLFIGGNAGDMVTGGEDADGNDIDVLDLTGSNVDRIEYTDGDPESGLVFFQNGETMKFSEIENVIPCFTPGTMIATPRGERLVEELEVGDRIITRDNGIQEIAWVGHKPISGKQLIQNPHLQPILIKRGALGHGLPERDMMVSPNHRVLVSSEKTQLYFEESEVLAAAKHMAGADGIHAVDVMQTTYIHFMFERHEVVLSNGAWTESFQPGDYSLKGIGNSQRNEIFDLFPELETKAGLEGYQSARKSLKKHEAKLLLK